MNNTDKAMTEDTTTPEALPAVPDKPLEEMTDRELLDTAHRELLMEIVRQLQAGDVKASGLKAIHEVIQAGRADLPYEHPEYPEFPEHEYHAVVNRSGVPVLPEGSPYEPVEVERFNA